VSYPIVLSVFAGLVGALGAYLATLRKLSGTVKHSEAEDLWTESRAIREDLTKRNDYLRQRLDRCEEKISSLERRIRDLEQENRELREENRQLKAAI
jgi:predicted nuclease with TOPRIM domain